MSTEAEKRVFKGTVFVEEEGVARCTNCGGSFNFTAPRDWTEGRIRSAINSYPKIYDEPSGKMCCTHPVGVSVPFVDLNPENSTRVGADVFRFGRARITS